MNDSATDDLPQQLKQLRRKNRRLKWIMALVIVGTIVVTMFVADWFQKRIFHKLLALPPLIVALDGWDAGYVRAKGTWTSFGGKMDHPIQTSEITCWKDMGYCFESVAQFDVGSSVYGMALFQDMYEIERWDQHQITTKPNETGLCVRDTIQIGRATKSVTSIGRYRKDHPLCKGFPDELHHVLVSGNEAMARLE